MRILQIIVSKLLAITAIVVGLLLLASFTSEPVTELLAKALGLATLPQGWVEAAMIMAVGALLVIMGMISVLPHVNRLGRDRSITFSDEQGEVVIQLDSVERSLNKVAASLEPVKKIHTRVTQARDKKSIEIAADVTLVNDAAGNARALAEYVTNSLRQTARNILGSGEIGKVRLNVTQILVGEGAAGPPQTPAGGHETPAPQQPSATETAAATRADTAEAAPVSGRSVDAQAGLGADTRGDSLAPARLDVVASLEESETVAEVELAQADPEYPSWELPRTEPGEAVEVEGEAGPVAAETEKAADTGDEVGVEGEDDGEIITPVEEGIKTSAEAEEAVPESDAGMAGPAAEEEAEPPVDVEPVARMGQSAPGSAAAPLAGTGEEETGHDEASAPEQDETETRDSSRE